MDHQTFAQLLGNYGEFIGSIAVVVTLIYLAGQLKQNTRALQSSAYQTYNERTDSYWDFEAQHAAVLAKIYEEQRDFDELISEQKLILTASMMKSFNVLEGMFLQHRAGTLGDHEFLAKAEAFEEAFRSPIIWKAWQRLGPVMAFTREFRAYMDTKVYGVSEPKNEDPYFSTFKSRE